MVDDDTIHWPKIRPGRSAIWHFDGELNTADPLYKKLLSAFGNVKSFPLDRIIIQFWKGVETTGGKRFLSCRCNPYAFSRVNRLLKKYRSGCIKYRYGIDLADQGDAMTIIDAPPFSVVRNYYPEVVLDLSVHQGTPLVDLALACELTCFMMLPVFVGTKCCGIVEVSMRFPGHLVVILNELSRVLQREGLSITPPEVCGRLPPSMTKRGGLRPGTGKVFKAIQVAVQSHAITLGQAWNPYLNPKRHYRVGWWLLDKLCYYYVVMPDDHLSFIRLFYDNFPVLPFIKGEGLIGRALETHQPHLCRNIYKLSDNKGVLGLLSANSNAKSCACFVICLRSCHTGELDYAFEFFWPHSSNHLALIEGLLLTLREHLPSFKYSSGAQLGDEIVVVDVNNSSSTPLKIFPGNKVSQTPKASVCMKRKFIDEGPSELNQANQYPLTYPEDDDDNDDDDELVIFAVYKVHQRLFFLPSSPTFEDVMDKIKQEFEDKLNPAGTYKVRYQVLPGEWFSLTDATCLKTCISSYRTSNNIDYVKFYVQEVQE